MPIIPYMRYTEKYKPPLIHGPHLPTEPMLCQEPVHGPWGHPRTLCFYAPTMPSVSRLSHETEWTTGHSKKSRLFEVTSCNVAILWRCMSFNIYVLCNLFVTYVHISWRYTFCDIDVLGKIHCLQLLQVVLCSVTGMLCSVTLCNRTQLTATSVCGLGSLLILCLVSGDHCFCLYSEVTSNLSLVPADHYLYG